MPHNYGLGKGHVPDSDGTLNFQSQSILLSQKIFEIFYFQCNSSLTLNALQIVLISMSVIKEKLGLYTDFYELVMAEGYFSCGKKNQQATFNYFFRTNPFNGGFTVFAGLADFLEFLTEFTFGSSDIQYLKEQGFRPEFLTFLKDFRFSGRIQSVVEGEIVFPNEPILRVDGNIIECQ